MDSFSVVSVERMRALDAAAIAAGFPADLLMEVAGFGAFQHLRTLIDPPGPVVILAGAGNNAGDAAVVARFCALTGLATTVITMRPPETSSGNLLATNWARLEHFPATVTSVDELDQHLASAAICVDGLLGTGAKGRPSPPYADVIRRANGAAAPILALDLPSGLCGDTGACLGDEAIQARWTVTFGAFKKGLLTESGQNHAGTVSLIPLSFPESAWRQTAHL